MKNIELTKNFTKNNIYLILSTFFALGLSACAPNTLPFAIKQVPEGVEADPHQQSSESDVQDVAPVTPGKPKADPLPELDEDKKTDFTKYNYVDPKHMINTKALKVALALYDQMMTKKKVENPNYLSVIDFSLHSSRKRLFIINMRTGNVEAYLVAHGRGSDPNFTGYAQYFSNVSGSKMSSLGLYKTAETYNSARVGFALKLDGLEKTNSRVRERGIVLHGSEYIVPDRGAVGRSWGCPAIDFKYLKPIIAELKHGSLLFAWSPKRSNKIYARF